MTDTLTRHATTRVRHEPRRRLLTVQTVERLTPAMARITLGGDLADFLSASYDDHVKVFFPLPGRDTPTIPPPDAPETAERSPGRDYTPRRYDRAANELEIEFVLHGEGPAASWARAARPGDRLGLGGPRGSSLLPEGLDWLLLIGDETALPAMARRLEEAGAGECIIALIETGSADARIDIATAANASITWLCRESGDAALPDAVAELILPEGHGFAWAAGEYGSIRQVRQRLINVHGLDRQRIRAASYWKQGEAASHETLTD